MSTKVCKKCGIEKDESLFTRQKVGDKNHPRNYCRECDAASSKKWREDNPQKAKEMMRNANLKRHYDISLEEYEQLLRKQFYRCALCGGDNPKTKSGVFVVDHCHNKGHIRALLCSTCNAGLGSFNDDTMLLHKAITYLVIHEKGAAKE